MNAVLRIKRKRQSEWAIVFIMALTLFYGIIDLTNISVLKYTMDVAWVFLLMTLIANRFTLPNEETKGLFNCIVAFLGSTLIGFVLNTWVPQYYLWGFRNNFRFYVFFLACAKFLDADHIEDYLKMMNSALYLHFVVAMIQYFAFGFKQDHLGGIFGTQEGNNSFSLVFMLIVMTYSVLSYLERRENLTQFAIKGVMAIMISVYSELKFFFVMCVVIVALCLLITRFTYKKLLIIILSAVGISVGAVILVRLFPNWAGWFSWDAMLENVTTDQGYTGKGDLNRLTAIPTVWTRFLTSWDKRLFGMGLGNCDNAAFSFLTTPFYKRYNHLHYHWFSSAFTILETGVVGFGLYIMFFVRVFLAAHKRERAGAAVPVYCQMAKVMSIVAVFMIVYNSSMRIEAGYMVYFVLALPFVRDNRMNKKSIENGSAGK